MSRLAILVSVALVIFHVSLAHASEFVVLHAFRGGHDGTAPGGGPALDASGTLYGSTCGATGCPKKKQRSDIPPTRRCSKSCGTLYAILDSGEKRTIQRFRGGNGANPDSPPLVVNGEIYGTTVQGGRFGRGTIFKIGTDGTETVLYSFCRLENCADGAYPAGHLVLDGAGDLFGVTSGGGGSKRDACLSNSGCGAVFRLAPDGTETVLYAFCRVRACRDGNVPVDLIADTIGNFYGTTYGGGAHSSGTVFKLATDNTETVLYSFCAKGTHGKNGNFPQCRDGANPLAGVTIDRFGNFYGTTSVGGRQCRGDGGCGTVFRLTPSGEEEVLHSFRGGRDGDMPFAGVVVDGRGNLYGTTSDGGRSGLNNPCSGMGCGTLFKIAPDGSETVLHYFCSSKYCADGAFPSGDLVLSGHYLFGSAAIGGVEACDYPTGCGTVFKVRTE